ncbi:MAG TPA: APC family permease [Capillimicrobium sp.]|nr:APC family permease [Capillimicrobium sp.]
MATAAERAAGGLEAPARLQRRALGVPDLVFFIVAASAPLTVVAGGQAATYLVTGNKGLPIIFLPLALVLGLFAVGYAAMSRHVADAGAFYTYVTRGLGRVAGVGTAFGALMAYNAMQLGIYGLFGVATASFMSDKIGITMDWYWWCLIGGAIIAVLGVLQVDLNAKVLAVLLILEIAVVAIFDFAILADPGPAGLTGTGWDPGEATDQALGSALVFSVAAFVGFESAAIYSEEVRDPKRTVARATFIAVASIGIFYALSSWFLANSVGPDVITNPNALVEGGFTTPDGAAPDPTTVLFIAGQDRLGAFWGDAASLLFCTSLFAALLSFHNAVARYFFALGRERVLPGVFSRVNRRTGAPMMGSITQTLIALVVVGAFAIADADPVLKLFTWLTNTGALGVLALMTVVSVAVVAYFRRNPDHGVGAWRTVIAPIIAGILLLGILILGVTNFNVLITGMIDAPTDSASIILPLLLLGAGLLGMLVALAIRSVDPERYRMIGERTAVERIEHVE